MRPAKRLQSVSEYYFSRKLKEIGALEASGKPIINLGIGSPDLPPSKKVIEVLKSEASKSDAHQYQSYQGIPELRSAISDFMLRQYQVTMDPTNEILPSMGSKEGITHISLAYLNKGDHVLIPELGYPTYTSVARMVEAEPVYYPLQESGEPDWDFFREYDFAKTRILWMNYPHMPTGYKGSYKLLERFVNIARDHGILLVHDNPYSFILNNNPLSIFQVPGSKEVGLELNSLSKTFNMAGWRVGWVCGEDEFIQNLIKIKSNMDSGMFKPVQLAAAEALKQKRDWFTKLDLIYEERRTVAQKILLKLGCELNEDQAGMFLWAKTKGKNADELVDDLLYNHSIFITPGHIFGERGRAFVRVSLCNPVEVLTEAYSRL